MYFSLLYHSLSPLGCSRGPLLSIGLGSGERFRDMRAGENAQDFHRAQSAQNVLYVQHVQHVIPKCVQNVLLDNFDVGVTPPVAVLLRLEQSWSLSQAYSFHHRLPFIRSLHIC